MSYDEKRIKTKWDHLNNQGTKEAVVPAMLFVLCKTVTEDESGALFLNGTLVERVLWEGEPPPTPNDKPYFKISLKGPLPGVQLEERRSEVVRDTATTTCMVYATIDLVKAPIDIQSHWSMFPFRILKGKVELELGSKLVDKDDGGQIMLCPDICMCNDIDKLVRVKDRGDMSRSRILALLRDMPTIEICEDRRRRKGVQGSTEQKDADTAPSTTEFVTHPQMTLTFWLHEPISKAAFKIFGPLFLILCLMLVNFEETYGFVNISDCFTDGKSYDHSSYLANVIAIAIAAVVVVPSIRSTSVTSTGPPQVSRSTDSCRASWLCMPDLNFTVDDLAALVFVIGLALSAYPHCGAALVGCFLSCTVMILAIGSLFLYIHECNRIMKEAGQELVRVKPFEKVTKSSAREFNEKDWERVAVRSRAQR